MYIGRDGRAEDVSRPRRLAQLSFSLSLSLSRSKPEEVPADRHSQDQAASFRHHSAPPFT
jgi:hypothetical protein